MGLPDAPGDLSSEVDVDAFSFRCLFPLRFYERHLTESLRPDGRARDTTIALRAVASAEGSALAKIGSTDIYCLDADGALFDAALLSAVAAFSHLQIPAVYLNDDGKIVVVSEENGGKLENDAVNKERIKTDAEKHSFLTNMRTSQELYLGRPHCRGRVHHGNCCYSGFGFFKSTCFSLQARWTGSRLCICHPD